MKVGARFSPVLTILFVSEVGRRHRNADFAFNRAVSMAFAAAPSMAWESMTLPPQSITAIATTCLFFSAHAEHASTRARAPALETTLMFRVSCCAVKSAAAEIMKSRQSENGKKRLRMDSSSSLLALGYQQ